MGHFVDGDLFEVGVERGVEAGACEVGLGEVLETLLIEGVFEMLQGESVVEDVGVSDGWGALTDLLQEGATVDASMRGSGLRRVRVDDSRLGDWAGSSDSSECCNGEGGLHGF